jgi:polyphosphate kinase
MLEQAGVHVVYGLVGLKTHAKVALVVRREHGRIRRYCHVGTGNYNPSTAGLYEDIGLLTAREDVGADLSELFNYLTGVSRATRYRTILVAPETLRSALRELIEAETAAGDGEIVLKVNALQDPEIIDALYRAGQAGTKIDLIVRGICCLRAGVPGLSENIRVRSIVGRFLEHSRIFRFGSAARGRRTFIGSADLMKRKLDHRVEVVVPVEDPALGARLEEILELALADDGRAWQQRPAGLASAPADYDGLDPAADPRVEWVRVPSSRNLRLHDELQERARRRADPARDGSTEPAPGSATSPPRS